MKTANVVLLGCGRVCQHYVTTLKDRPDLPIRVTHVCDTDAVKAKQVASVLACEALFSIDDVVTVSGNDFVVVLTPSGDHFEHSKKLLENGFNVLCEKPLAMTVGQCETLIKLAERQECLLSVAFQNRFNPAVKFAEKLMRENRFGKIVTASVRLLWSRPQEYYEDGWHGTWSSDGGVINQQAIHHIDALQLLLGPINLVNAKIANRVNDLEAEDTLVAIAEAENGALVTIQATTGIRPMDVEASVNIYGDKGYIEVGGVALNEIVRCEYEDQDIELAELQSRYNVTVPNGYGLSHAEVLGEMASSTIFGGKVPVNPTSGAIATEIIHALYASDEMVSWASVGKDVSSRLGKS